MCAAASFAVSFKRDVNDGRPVSAHDVLVAVAGDLRIVHAESDDDDVGTKIEDAGLEQLQTLKRGISEHAEILDFVPGVGLLLMEPCRQPAGIRLILPDGHPERPRIADARDAYG